MKKTFTAEEVTEIENKSYETGVSTGFHQMYEITDRAIKHLRTALEEVWSIEHNEVRADVSWSKLEKLEFAINTLTHLEDIIESKTYEEKP